MDEIEVPLENTQEHVQHAALHSDSNSKLSLVNLGALLSAVLAVFAAISALLAGHYSNEAMIEQIKASDQWAYYQSKGIKSSLQDFRLEMNSGESAEKTKKIEEKIEKYKQDQEKIQEKAKELEETSEKYLRWHERLAMAVTFFQVGIAVIAIGVLTRKKMFVYGGAGSGLIGLCSFVSFFFLH